MFIIIGLQKNFI